MQKKGVSLLLAFTLLPSLGIASSVEDWIMKMNDSSHRGNYQGTFIFSRNNNVEAMRVEHGTKEGKVWVSLTSLNGEPRQLIHENGEVISIFPKKQLVSINEMTSRLPFHPDLPEDIHQLTEHYELRLSGQDRIADRETQIVSVAPKDVYRYGFNYWLDKQTGMMLRCDVIDKKKQVLERIMYTDLQFMKHPPEKAFSKLQIPASYQMLKQRETKKIIVGDNWKIAKLPDGFMMTKNVMKPMSKSQAALQQMVFSDGLATVSVFIDSNVSDMHKLDGATSMGSVNAFGLMKDNHQITAIGEVPVETVRMIAESIQHKE